MALLAVNPEWRQTRGSREVGTGLPRQAQAGPGHLPPSGQPTRASRGQAEPEIR